MTPRKRTPTVSESLTDAVASGRVRVRKPAAVDTFTTIYPKPINPRHVKSPFVPQIR